MALATESKVLVKKSTDIRSAVAYILKNGGALAIWRLPGEKTIHLAGNANGSLENITSPIEEAGFGFVFHPFHQPGSSKKLLRPELYFSYLIHNEQFISEEQHFSSTLTELEFVDHNGQKDENALLKWHFKKNHPPGSEKEWYIKYVENSIGKIRSNQFHKVVPARTRTIKLEKDVDWLLIFRKLCIKYPSAFVSLTSTQEFGTWIGASPELLLSSNAQGIFKTTSLAGTQLFEEGKKLGDVLWSQKEIEEQALVSRYIINCFKKIRLREFEEIGPKTIRAANLVHLKTEFIVDMHKVRFPELTGVMLELLHPTSAVCGMPKEKVLPFLLEWENFDRALYSGYLGPVNLNEKTEIYVNLRSLQVTENELILYSGAGVTEDSDPEKEWLETEMKMKTLLQIIF